MFSCKSFLNAVDIDVIYLIAVSRVFAAAVVVLIGLTLWLLNALNIVEFRCKLCEGTKKRKKRFIWDEEQRAGGTMALPKEVRHL